jgi:hypothetical protein
MPAFARSVHVKSLWYALAPLIPVQILVPVERADEAAALLQHHLGTDATGRSIQGLTQAFD